MKSLYSIAQADWAILSLVVVVVVLWNFISKAKLPTLVEVDRKPPFSIATTPRWGN